MYNNKNYYVQFKYSLSLLFGLGPKYYLQLFFSFFFFNLYLLRVSFIVVFTFNSINFNVVQIFICIVYLFFFILSAHTSLKN